MTCRAMGCSLCPHALFSQARSHMSAKSGNVVILKDIHNLATRAQAATDKSKALEDAIQELKKSSGW